MNWLICGIIVLIVVLLFSSSRDHYGQDPSIRASVGWVAGPLYGYDPVAEFARQIKEECPNRGRVI